MEVLLRGGDDRGPFRDWCCSSTLTAILGTLFFSLPQPLPADFLEPMRISTGERRVLQSEAGADLSFNAYVLWTEGQAMNAKIISTQTSRNIVLSDLQLGSGDPSIATNSVGTTFIFLTEDHPELGGRQILMTSNPGGSFSLPPAMVSTGISDNYAPRIAIGADDRPYVTWVQYLGNLPRVIYYPPGGPPVAVVSEAQYPSIAVDSHRTAHIVYTRNNDLFMINSRDGSPLGPPSAVTRTPFDAELFSSVAVSEAGATTPNTVRVFVAYERDYSLFYQESIDGGNRFGPPHLIDSGGVLTPNMRVSPQLDGVPLLSIVYSKGGRNYYTFGKVGGTLVPPALITTQPAAGVSPEIESNPSLAIDTRGSLHVTFLRDGQVYYTNNSGGLTAQFSSDKTQGEFPLEIHFTDLSSGFVDFYEWNFGDGNSSNERNPVHVYTQPGKFTVTLLIRGPSTEATITKEDYVAVQTPNNKVWMTDQSCFPGQKDIWFPVYAKHKDKALQGFEFAGRHDPHELILKEITTRNTALDAVPTEFYSDSFTNEPSKAYFYAGAIFDWKEPWDNQVLPPSEAQVILNLIFDCAEDASQGETTLVEPRNDVGPQGGLHNVFAVLGGPKNSVLPVLAPSLTTILKLDDLPPTPFQRGNVDWSPEVDLTDAVTVLGYLFLGVSQPTCVDAADVDDSGAIDIADPINLLAFLFLGGNPPAVPFPNPGLDPTDDEFPPCRP